IQPGPAGGGSVRNAPLKWGTTNPATVCPGSVRERQAGCRLSRISCATLYLVAPPATEASAAMPPATVLNVDDNEDARTTLSWVLRANGFDVWEAATGRDALRLAADQPDLV